MYITRDLIMEVLILNTYLTFNKFRKIFFVYINYMINFINFNRDSQIM